jgi:hypothetical protein
MLPVCDCVCKYLEIRPSPDRSPPGPSVEKHSGQGTFSELPDTVVPPLRLISHTTIEDSQQAVYPTHL